MNRSVVVAAALALAAFSVSGAQDSLSFVADREMAAQLTRIVADARARGLPTDPIVAKARRGVISHAPSVRIIAAAEAVARRLEQARIALAPQPTAADIMAGEDALSISGVTVGSLRSIRALSPSGPVAVPIGVLAQLIASGVPASRATAIVTDLMRRGATTKQLVALGNDVNADVAGGAHADASLEVRLNGLTPYLPGAAAAAQAAGLSTFGGAGAPKKP